MIDYAAQIDAALAALEQAVSIVPQGSLTYQVALALFQRADQLVSWDLEALLVTAPDYPHDEDTDETIYC